MAQRYDCGGREKVKMNLSIEQEKLNRELIIEVKIKSERSKK